MELIPAGNQVYVRSSMLHRGRWFISEPSLVDGLEAAQPNRGHAVAKVRQRHNFVNYCYNLEIEPVEGRYFSTKNPFIMKLLCPRLFSESTEVRHHPIGR